MIDESMRIIPCSTFILVVLSCPANVYPQLTNHPAWLHYVSADYEEVVATCDSLLRISRFDTVSHYLRGLSSFHARDYSRAAESLEKATSSVEFSKKAWYYLSIIQTNTGLLQRSLLSAQSAVRSDSACVQCVVKLVTVLAILNRFEEAAAEVERNKSPATLLALGERLLRAKRCAAAVDLFTTNSYLLDSSSYAHQIIFGDALRCAGRFAEARDVYERLKAHASRRPEILKRLGETYGWTGQNDLAIVYLKLYLSASADTTVSILSDLGRLFYSQARYDSALTYFKIAAERDSTSPETHYNLGLALSKVGKYRDAAVAFETSVALSGEVITGYERRLQSLATAYSESGRSWKAIRAYRKMVGLNPNCFDCWYRLAIHYEEVGDSTSARDAFQWFLRTAPKGQSLREMRAYAQQRFDALEPLQLRK
jgi:tetratricopeptide (TPR) repeat protein